MHFTNIRRGMDAEWMMSFLLNSVNSLHRAVKENCNCGVLLRGCVLNLLPTLHTTFVRLLYLQLVNTANQDPESQYYTHTTVTQTQGDGKTGAEGKRVCVSMHVCQCIHT